MKVSQGYSYNDVLILPRYSDVSSRKNVDLSVTLAPGIDLKIPIISSCMDTVTEDQMAISLAKMGGLGIIHRFCSIEEQVEMVIKVKDQGLLVGAAVGATDDYLLRAQVLIEAGVDILCVDVAHGHHSLCGNAIMKIKKIKNIPIIAGNVCTPSGVEYLVNCKADCIRLGVGNGCFRGDTKILMSDGSYKNIQDIEINDYVINMKGSPVRVINKWNKGIKKVIKVRTNNWYCSTYVTPDHSFWTIENNLFLGDTLVERSGDADWKQIYTIDTDDHLLLPRKIDWDLPEKTIIHLIDFYNVENSTFGKYIETDYNLGYIFGRFLVYGHYNDGLCYWEFDLDQESIVNKLFSIIKENIGLECRIEKENISSPNVIRLHCSNQSLIDLLINFKKGTRRYYCNNAGYAKGLLDGISVHKNHIDKVTCSVAELYYWCINILGINNDYEVSSEYIFHNIICKEESEEFEVWDIEVDCDTHSFIANNSIVHNSICTTRIQTGCGYPQFSTVLECSKKARELGVTAIADGGFSGVTGNMFKALAAGAHACMLGKSLAGTSESPGDIINIKGSKVKVVRGMASIKANASKLERTGDTKDLSEMTPEGVDGFVEYRGDVKKVVGPMLGGLRSGFSYQGCLNISELHKHLDDGLTEYCVITASGLEESRSHGLKVI